jgi:hypothetical protein
MDIVYLGITFAFFALTLGLVALFERLRKPAAGDRT